MTKEYRVEKGHPIWTEVEPGVVYLAEHTEGSGVEKLLFLCPCGCGDYQEIPVFEGAQPKWDYRLDGGKLTVTPSINRLCGCKSHYFITENKVRMV